MPVLFLIAGMVMEALQGQKLGYQLSETLFMLLVYCGQSADSEAERMSIDTTYFRLERIIGSGAECFLCLLEDEIERKYFDAYLSELVMDAKVREKKSLKARDFAITIHTNCSLLQVNRKAQMAMESP